MILLAERAILSALHSRCIERGGGTWPDEAPATSSDPWIRGTVPIPLRCDRTPHVGLRHRATEAFNVERGVQCLSRHWLARNVELSTSWRRATFASAASARWRCATTMARWMP